MVFTDRSQNAAGDASTKEYMSYLVLYILGVRTVVLPMKFFRAGGGGGWYI